MSGIVGTAAVSVGNGTPVDDQHTPGGEKLVTVGGRITVAVVAGTPLVVKPSAGRLCKVLVTATGSANGTFYDSPSAAEGTVIGVIPSTATVGQVIDLQFPAASGIYWDGHAGAPPATVSID
jgi:hypothetical protein